MSNNLRPRVPFRFTEDGIDEPVDAVLDEQQQEDVITRLKVEASAWNLRYLYALEALVAVSFFMQLLCLFNPSIQNVFSAMLQTPAHDVLPWSTFHSLLSLALHFYLLSLAQMRSSTNVDHLRGFGIPGPLLNYPVLGLLYFLTTIPAAASLLSGKLWTTTLWWSCPLILTIVIETMGKAIDEEKRSLVELEGKKYVAPNA